ncbi:DUF4920 domain-containing protein [Chitinophaga niabensis]|uniref:DUF4920 domain-containing protein n=1 Tax=Chitinophaga niabensis TaxID=536979 RepID=A0A1N6D127_9BACT|nr:DUF4920 domain-containing protein [Chitinophaga niabensis]SIN64520.1 protein of unknown function [Chitinophaga niabensis]
MRKTYLLLLAGLFAATASIAQTNITPAQAGVTYGKAINAEQAIEMADLHQKLQSDTIYTGKVEGKVVEVCKKKGCFMKLERASGEPVMVKFTDYAFFMPQNIVGKTVVVEGVAKVNETSVERLKHFAEDAGKSKAEIAKITAPKKDIVIVADGVVVVK